MALRTFTSSDGTVWNVWNVVPTLAAASTRLSVQAGMADGWLCFECPTSKRRLFPVPAGWEQWPDDALERTLAGAEEVKPRARAATPAPRGAAAAGDEAAAPL